MTVKWHWGTGIGLVYAAFASATLGFAVFAMRQPVELVSGDYYQQALKHDDRLAAEANAKSLGDTFSAVDSSDGRIVTIDWTKSPPAAGAGAVLLYRPSDVRFDRAIPLQPDDQGRQRVSLHGLAAGRWVVKIQWRSGDRDYYFEHAVVAQ
jgi:nitrogen fixation protein FixH